jgi:uncharacterized membrane protein
MKNNILISTLFIFSFILSYLITIKINYLPKKNKIKNHKQKLILYWNNYTIHIHHWLSFLIIILILLIGKYSNNFIFIFLIASSLGIMMEGFLFDNWHKFIIV